MCRSKKNTKILSGEPPRDLEKYAFLLEGMLRTRFGLSGPDSLRRAGKRGRGSASPRVGSLSGLPAEPRGAPGVPKPCFFALDPGPKWWCKTRGIRWRVCSGRYVLPPFLEPEFATVCFLRFCDYRVLDFTHFGSILGPPGAKNKLSWPGALPLLALPKPNANS